MILLTLSKGTGQEDSMRLEKTVQRLADDERGKKEQETAYSTAT